MSNRVQVKKGEHAQPTFEKVVGSIQTAHAEFAARVGRAINACITVRNWLIGCYIVEYELKGLDRAKYGDRLLSRLASRLQKCGVARSEERELRRYRRFYLVYPQIRESLTPELRRLRRPSKQQATVIWESVSPESQGETHTLLTKLSFSHIVELLAIEDNAKRSFYQAECVRGGWSVRELKRQMATLYFERSGLSRNKKRIAALARRGAQKLQPVLDIRDPYIFEFLGLKPQEVMTESRLEDLLLDKLQDFLLELGHGFCFEARQKRILIGDTYGFVDLVFYHRILKCHVLIDLKLEPFTHENIGQINTYVTWYRKHEMASGDNLPIGILLCAQKDQALAEYALAGMDNRLFVSKYQLHLPKIAQLRKQLEQSLKEQAYK